MSALVALQRALRRHRLVIEQLAKPVPDENEFKRRGRLSVLTAYTEEAAVFELFLRTLTVEEVTK